MKHILLRTLFVIVTGCCSYMFCILELLSNREVPLGFLGRCTQKQVVKSKQSIFTYFYTMYFVFKLLRDEYLGNLLIGCHPKCLNVNQYIFEPIRVSFIYSPTKLLIFQLRY